MARGDIQATCQVQQMVQRRKNDKLAVTKIKSNERRLLSEDFTIKFHTLKASSKILNNFFLT
jgi:hypothetical protein